jgi:hypothetical protein
VKTRRALVTSAALILFGCGGNVVVDGASSRGVGGVGGASASSSGMNTASSSSGTGGSPVFARWHLLGAASPGGAFEDPAIALDPSGVVYVAARFNPGPGTLSTLPLPCPSQAILLAAVAPDGTIRWAKCASCHGPPDPPVLELEGITAATPNQLTVLAGFGGELDYDGQSVADDTDKPRAILMTLDPATGDVIANRSFPNDPRGWTVAGNAAGDLYLAGSTSTTLDLGAVSFTPATNELGVFVAKIEASGAGAWITEVAHTTLPESTVTLTLSADGARLALVGTFQGTTDFGPATENDSLNPLLVELDAASGSIEHGLYPQGASQRGTFAAASFDAEDDLVVSGTAYGPLDLGAGTFLQPGGANFIVKLGPSGNVLWQQQLAPYAGQGPFFLPVAIGPGGDISYALTMNPGSLSIAGGTVDCPEAAGACSVIGGLSANGASDGGAGLIAGAFQPITSALARSPDERIVAGTFKDWIDFGEGHETHPPAGGGLFIAAFPP